MMWKIVVIFAVTTGTFAADYQCTLSDSHLDCTEKKLTLPPSGYWPGITRLTLNQNPITQFPKNSLSGFPDVTQLSAENTLLRELDFGELVVMSKLIDLTFEESRVEKLIPAPSGKTFDNLFSFNLYRNRLSTLDPNFFLNAPILNMLSLNENPIEVIPGRPIANHPSVRYIWFGMGNSIGQWDSTLLSGVPNLEFVSLPYAGITNISGALVNHKFLNTIYLMGNNISEIISNYFPSEGLLRVIDLSENPLKRLDIAAVNKAMKAERYSYLLIDDTPLACGCKYQVLFWWAISKKITLSTECSEARKCFFNKRSSASSRKAISPFTITQYERDVLGQNIRSH